MKFWSLLAENIPQYHQTAAELADLLVRKERQRLKESTGAAYTGSSFTDYLATRAAQRAAQEHEAEIHRLAVEQLRQEQLNAEVQAEVARLRRT